MKLLKAHKETEDKLPVLRKMVIKPNRIKMFRPGKNKKKLKSYKVESPPEKNFIHSIFRWERPSDVSCLT